MKHVIYHRPSDSYVKGFKNNREFDTPQEAEFHIDLLARTAAIRSKKSVKAIKSEYSIEPATEAQVEVATKITNEAPKKPVAARSTPTEYNRTTTPSQNNCRCGFWLNSPYIGCPCKP